MSGTDRSTRLRQTFGALPPRRGTLPLEPERPSLKDVSPLAVTTSGGRALVVLATLSRIDRDGDLILPDSLDNGPDDLVPISAWEHQLVFDDQALPVGQAKVFEREGRLMAEVEFFGSDDDGH
jgi:hypothetical protein